MPYTPDIEATDHRPWPFPDRPWVIRQSWLNLLFAHWKVAPDRVRRRVPAPLELDLHHGDAWIGLAPFVIDGFRIRGLPPLPGLSRFPELNLRTYVRAGGRPGIYFFSLDAGSLLAVAGARLFFRLPYHRADMDVTESDGRVEFRSRRAGSGARFRASYEPVGPAVEPPPGSLEHFLAERYAFFVVRKGGRIFQTEIHHPPWLLRPAGGVIQANDLATAEGVVLPDAPPLLHFSRRQDTLIWAPTVIG